MKINNVALFLAVVLLAPRISTASSLAYDQYTNPSLADSTAKDEARLNQLNLLTDLPGVPKENKGTLVDPNLADKVKEWLSDDESVTKAQDRFKKLSDRLSEAVQTPILKQAVETKAVQDKIASGKRIAGMAKNLVTSLVPPPIESPREDACSEGAKFDRTNQLIQMAGQPLQEFQSVITKALKKDQQEDQDQLIAKIKKIQGAVAKTEKDPDEADENEDDNSDVKGMLKGNRSAKERAADFNHRADELLPKVKSAEKTAKNIMGDFALELIKAHDVKDKVQEAGMKFVNQFKPLLIQAHQEATNAAKRLNANCEKQGRLLGKANPTQPDPSTGFGMAMKEAQDHDNIGYQMATMTNPAAGANFIPQAVNQASERFQNLAQNLTCPKVTSAVDNAVGPQIQAQLDSITKAEDPEAMMQAVMNVTKSLQSSLPNLNQIGKLSNKCDQAVDTLREAKQYAKLLHQTNQEDSQKLGAQYQATQQTRQQQQQVDQQLMFINMQNPNALPYIPSH